jgi:hypothetical protein
MPPEYDLHTAGPSPVVICYYQSSPAEIADCPASRVANDAAAIMTSIGDPACLHRVSCIIVWSDSRPDKPADLTPATPSRYYPGDRKIQILASWYNAGTLAHELGHALHCLQRVGPDQDAVGRAIWAAGATAWGWAYPEGFAEAFRNWTGPVESGRVVQPGQPEYFRLCAALPGR